MKIESKYEIGQKLWGLDFKHEYEICGVEHLCGIKSSILGNMSYFIKDITNNSLINVRISESIIDRAGGTLFTTREAAIAECERRNAELRGAEDE